jgi:hypothetical protein
MAALILVIRVKLREPMENAIPVIMERLKQRATLLVTVVALILLE